MKVVEYRVLKKKYKAVLFSTVAVGILTGTALLYRRNKGKEQEHIKQLMAELSAEQEGRIISFAGECLGMNRMSPSPYDSDAVKKLRRASAVRTAERALFTILLQYTSMADTGICSVKGCSELIRGDYTLNTKTPIEAQMANAETTVSLLKECAQKNHLGNLEGMSNSVLLRGAVLLENDLCWCAGRKAE